MAELVQLATIQLIRLIDKQITRKGCRTHRMKELKSYSVEPLRKPIYHKLYVDSFIRRILCDARRLASQIVCSDTRQNEKLGDWIPVSQTCLEKIFKVHKLDSKV